MTQQLEALERANEVRFARAELKKAIKAGDVKVAEILLGDIPDWLAEMRLEQLCNSIPRYQWRAYERLMQETHTSLYVLVGNLTKRKRTLIAEQLAEWEEGAASRRRARSRRHRAKTDSARRAAA